MSVQPNYDLTVKWGLNFGCVGYQYYIKCLEDLFDMVRSRYSGIVVLFHYQSDDIWKVCRLNNGLLEGMFLQDGGIVSPTIRASYMKGYLHGYRVVNDGHMEIEYYVHGNKQFQFSKYTQVFRYVNHTPYFELSSPKLCLLTLVTRIQRNFLYKRANSYELDT